MRFRTLLLIGMFTACGGGGDVDLDDDSELGDDDDIVGDDDDIVGDDDDDTNNVRECEPVISTGGCGTEAAIVRATIEIPPGASATQGALFFGISHEYLGGGATGGYYHTSKRIPNVDLSDGPISVELDMCTGGAMYSEDNCSYNFFAFLDLNDNADPNSFLPDPGEPAASILGVNVSCQGDSQCLNLVLDCEDGQNCVRFQDPAGGCECAPQTCGSDYVTCF